MDEGKKKARGTPRSFKHAPRERITSPLGAISSSAEMQLGFP